MVWECYPKRRTKEWPRDWAKKCVWCGREIAVNNRIFMGLAAATQAYKERLKKLGGKMTTINFSYSLEKHKVEAMVLPEWHHNKKKGYDLAFGVCSEVCFAALEDALEREIPFSEQIEGLEISE